MEVDKRTGHRLMEVRVSDDLQEGDAIYLNEADEILYAGRLSGERPDNAACMIMSVADHEHMLAFMQNNGISPVSEDDVVRRQ